MLWLLGYAAALGVLSVAAFNGWYKTTIVLAAAVAAAGISIHRLLGDRPDQRLSAWQMLVLAAAVEIGFGLCVAVGGRVFSALGFLGLSFVGFGLARGATEIRRSRLLGSPAARLACGNLVAGLVLAVGFGVGGWPLLLASAVLVVPAIGFGTEATLNVLEQKRENSTKVKVFKVAGPVVLALGLVLAVPSIGLVPTVLAAGIAFALIGAIASNTDADILFVLVAAAIVWAQFPRTEHDLPPARPAGTILSLGDSYISGEGARTYYAGTNTRTRIGAGSSYDQCRRAPTAYSPLVAEALDMSLVFLACSGAKVDNVLTEGQYRHEGESEDHRPLSQLAIFDNLQSSPTPTWVLVSIGGNDVGFGSLVQACLAPGDCAERSDQWDGALVTLGPKLDSLYKVLHDRWGDKVVAVPYPVPLRDTSCNTLRSTLTASEHRYLAGFVDRLDAVISDEAARNQIRFLTPVQHAFDPVEGTAGRAGTRICDAAADLVSVNYLALNPVGGDIDPTAWVHNSMHPNERGHARLAQVVTDWLRHPDAPASPPTTPPPAQPTPSAAAVQATEDPFHGGDSRWMLVETRSVLRGRPGLAIALILLGAWLTWVELLRMARVARQHGKRARPDDSTAAWTREHAALAVFRSPSLLARGVGLFLAIGTTVVITTALARIVGLPQGYGGAQSARGATLALRSPAELRAFRRGALRDFVAYVPLYLVIVIVLLATVSPIDPDVEREREWRPWRRATWTRRNLTAWLTQTQLTWLSMALAVIAAGADAIETWQFRTTLGRLLNGETAAAVDGATRGTAVWTHIKFSFLIGAGLLLAVNVLFTRPKRSESPAAPRVTEVVAGPGAVTS